jgi:hypothetical protein
MGAPRPYHEPEGIHTTTLPATAGVISLLEGLSFLFMALLHAGVQVPLGFVVATDVPIPPATVVEGLCGIALLVGAAGLLSGQPWMWAGAMWSQAISLAGVLMGMGFVQVGVGPHSVVNDIYHRVIAVLLALGIVALLLPPVRRSLGAAAGPRR